jgi:DNA-binding MarR family transcriptional regulator
MKSKRLAVADGVDAMAVARELMCVKPAQARVLVAIHRGHDTVPTVAGVLGIDTRAVHSTTDRLAHDGYIVKAWPIDEAFDDIPTITPTGKTLPARGGGSTRTKGRK